MARRTHNAAHDWFGDPLPVSALKQRSVTGVLASSSGLIGQQAVRLASLIVLSRLLTPDDFGLVAMIIAFTGLANIFQDLGLSGATVRAKEISRPQISNLFWINLTAGTLMMLIIIGLSAHIQDFYQDDRIQTATMVMALSFLLGGLTTQHLALLRRAMWFAHLAMITVTSALTTALVALIGALLDLGYWALIFGSLSGSLVTLVMAWWICDWRASLPQRYVGTRPLARFGLHLALFNLLGFVATHVHTLIIGRLWSAVEAGLFNRADTIKNLFLSSTQGPFNHVAPAAMARLVDHPAQYCNYYYKASALIVIAFIPIVFVCAVLPSQLVSTVLGDQWTEATIILQLLSVGLLPQIISTTSGWVYLSAGDSKRMMQWGLIGWPAIILSALIGAQWSIEGIAIALSASAVCLVVPCLLFAFHGTPLQVTALCRHLWQPIVAGILASLAGIAVLQWSNITSDLLTLLVVTTAFCATYAVLLFTVFDQWPIVADVINNVKRPDRNKHHVQ